MRGNGGRRSGAALKQFSALMIKTYRTRYFKKGAFRHGVGRSLYGSLYWHRFQGSGFRVVPKDYEVQDSLLPAS